MYTDSHDYTNTLAIFTVVGFWLILTYGVEHNLKADIFHYSGVCLGMIGSFGGLLISQNYSILSLSITGIAIANFILYAVVSTLKLKKEHIHYQSLIMLVSESVVIILAAIAGCIYVWNLTDQ